MGSRGIHSRRGLASFLCLVIGIFFFNGCATQPMKQVPSEESQVPIIQSIDVRSVQHKAILEINSDRPTHFTAFQLVDPPRIILDVRGKPAESLERSTRVEEGGIKEISVQKGRSQPMTTRLVIKLEEVPIEYKTQSLDRLIRLILTPKGALRETPQEKPVAVAEAAEEKETPAGPYTPRIFFKPKADNGLNQILGIDFTMLNQGKSRLIITTEQKAPYHLEQKGLTSLLLTMERSTIPPLLMRRLESIYFEGAVDRVRASTADSRVAMLITLKEMVPFHVDQTDQAITIDFGPTSIRPPEKTIVPIKEAKKEAEIRPVVAQEGKGAPAAGIRKTAAESIQKVAMVQSPALPAFMKKKYKGAPMTMDFVNADVTNILRLIAEVSNLNIVWGPEVKGNVSMRLKNVPWDQALDLILANNNLGMRREGNVIWITTKAQLAKIEAEERRKRAEYEAELQKRREAEKKAKEAAKELEPLVTEYLPLDFATTEEIKAHLEPLLSERGKLSEDARTNTIIITDLAQKIEEAKKIVERFDTPVKQIMIEARIVDATTNFTRDLGVQWGGTTSDEVGIDAQRRDNTGVTFGIPTDATGFSAGGDNLVGGTFSSNSPEGWNSNLGFTFGYLTTSALGAITLDARLALSETEGTAKVISAPKVIASNGEEAYIKRGDEFVAAQAAENVEPTIMEASLELTVTPTVSFNDFVTMELTVKDEQKTGSDSKRTKEVKTKMMVKSGETIVIGGIYKQNRTDDESGIPYLRKIPVLGWLFKADRKTFRKSELLVFITPTVLPPPGQARARAL